MSELVVFSATAAQEIEDTVRRVRRMPLGNPLDDGSDAPEQPWSVITEIRIIGSPVQLGGGSGASSSSGKTCRPIYPAKSLEWTGCDHAERDDVWAIELNDEPLIVGRKYPAKLIQHDFQTDEDDDATERMLCQIYVGDAFANESDDGSSGSSAGSGIPVNICTATGTTTGKLKTQRGRLVVIDDDGDVLLEE